jgi:hypothetical protein
MAMKMRNEKERQTQMPMDYEFRKTMFCKLIEGFDMSCEQAN